MTRNIHPSWFFMVPYLQDHSVLNLLEEITKTQEQQPRRERIFEAFRNPLKHTKIVILGEETYPAYDVSTGYAYKSQLFFKKTREEQAIEDMVKSSDPFNINPSEEMDLLSWVDQGVLLLNTSLTVGTGNPGSHKVYWEDFMQRLISTISTLNPCIWVVWGENNKKFIGSIHNTLDVNNFDRESIKHIHTLNSRNYLLSGPGPTQKGFKDLKHPYFINEILQKLGKPKMIW